MIILEIKGGLGSQLFQICTLISYSNHFKTGFKIKKNKKDTINKQGYPRPTYWHSFFNELNPYLIESSSLYLNYKQDEIHFKELPYIEDPNKDFELEGWFRSPIYFHNDINLINSILKFTDKKKIVQEKYGEIFDKETISLHFRIGDFKHPNKLEKRCILKFSYYKNALKEIIKKTNKKDYIVLYFNEKEDNKKVSDYIRYIKKDKQLKGIKFKQGNLDTEDWHQMLLMSNCNHNIMANSCLSWWSSYLNENPNKIITYPEDWYGSDMKHIKTDNLFPFKNWIKINN